jgi:hypothetical protein
VEVGGVSVPNPVPILNGAELEQFFDDVVCGTADVVLAGHDHNRQWLDENDALCGAEMIVSGAGSSVREIRDRGNAVHYADGSVEGFMYVVIEGDTFRGEFIDKAGNLDFERTLSR